MSLINDALKRAQRQRSPDQGTGTPFPPADPAAPAGPAGPADPGGPGGPSDGQPAAAPAPRSRIPARPLRVVIALAVTVIFAVIFLRHGSHPAAPTPAPEATPTRPAAPAAQPVAGASQGVASPGSPAQAAPSTAFANFTASAPNAPVPAPAPAPAPNPAPAAPPAAQPAAQAASPAPSGYAADGAPAAEREAPVSSSQAPTRTTAPMPSAAPASDALPYSDNGDSGNPRPVQAYPAPAPAATPSAPASPAAPAPVQVQAVPTPAVGATNPDVHPDDRIQAIVDGLHIMGIRASGTDSKVLLNERIYRLGDIVDRDSGLKLVWAEPGTLTFVDSNGAVYKRSF